MQMNAKMAICCILVLICALKGEEIKVIEQEGEITFSNIADISVPLTEYTSIEAQKYVIAHSILSIQVIANSTEAICDKKGKCDQPIRLYSKLNAKPQPEEFYFDKKDDSGKYKEGMFFYGLEYSPCQFGMNDTLYIKLVCLDGKATYKIKVLFDYLNDFKIKCLKLNGNMTQLPLRIHPAMVSTRVGTIQFGGILPSDSTVDDSLYVLDNEYVWREMAKEADIESSNKNLAKEKMPGQEKEEGLSHKWPSAREGALMLQIDNDYVMLFGGKDKQEKCLNDLWALNINTFKWIHINYNGSQKIPQCKYLSTGQHLHSKGCIIIFGGKNTPNDKSIYLIDLKLLKESIQYNLNPIYYTTRYESFSYEDIISQLYQIIEIPTITHRYGLTITPIDNDNVLLFGGFDEKDTPLSTEEILNVNTFKLELINHTGLDFPSPRGFHSMMKYGSIVFLFGGKGENFNHKDMWKFIIPIRKWVQVKSSVIDQPGMFSFLQRSQFEISKTHNDDNSNERPILIGGDVISNELTSDITEFNVPLCKSDSMIYSDMLCLPCSEGYENLKGKCDKCYPGKYLQWDIASYSKAICVSCPEGTYNALFAQESLSKCLACPYETYNNEKGQMQCKECPNDSICLPGSTLPLSVHKPLVESNVQKRSYLFEDNYPEFIDQNSKMKLLSLTTGVITVSALTTIVIIIIAICLQVAKEKTKAFLLCVDFLPLTGGNEKKSNGGCITIIYSILICSLAISFILRYLLWNDIVEITTIDNSKETKPLSESFRLTIEVIGNEIPCASIEDTSKEKWRSCNDDILFSKNDDPYFFIDKRKLFTCSSEEGRSNQCIMRFSCLDCKDITHKDTLNIFFKDKKSYVQLYNWEFASYWSESIQDKEKGYSIIKGIFKPYQNIQYNYVFKGSKPSTISFLLTPIYYTMKSEHLELAGYRASLNSYDRGAVKNEYTLTNQEEGVRLDIKFTISQSSHQVNVKKDISLIDFFAFLLGMLAGFSFLSRISKFVMEKCNWLNYSIDNFQPLKEEVEAPKEAELSIKNEPAK